MDGFTVSSNWSDDKVWVGKKKYNFGQKFKMCGRASRYRCLGKLSIAQEKCQEAQTQIWELSIGGPMDHESGWDHGI